MNFFVFLFFTFLSLNAFSSKSSCKLVFPETKNQKDLDTDWKNIYKTEKFLDKKYSLSFVKSVSKSLSLNYVLNNYPVLDKKDQLKLAKFYEKNKDDRSFLILFFSNFRLVLTLANRFTYRDRQLFDDYFQEGLLGLSTSIQRFDSARLATAPVPSYMGQWIKFSMMRYGSRKAEITDKAIKKDSKQTDNAPEFSDILDSISTKENLEKRETNRLYLEQIYKWVDTQLEVKKEKKDLWMSVTKERVFTYEDPISRIVIAKRFNVSKVRIYQIENKIREMITEEFQPLNPAGI